MFILERKPVKSKDITLSEDKYLRPVKETFLNVTFRGIVSTKY